MPKDKTTTRKTKAKGAAEGGKKKKGKLCRHHVNYAFH